MTWPDGFREIQSALRDRVLTPYLEGCAYVKHAAWRSSPDHQSAALRAQLAIARSCYIKDTGHFNAVEANIAFNQMFYLLAAAAVDGQSLIGFDGMPVEEWLARQLPHVLIKDYAFQFRSVIDRRDFQGELVFESVIPKTKFVVFNTTCRFFDAAGGEANGRVCLMFDNRHLAGEEGASDHG